MDAKLFKAFTPFVNLAGGGVSRALFEVGTEKFDDYESKDPSPTQWGSMGFIPVTVDEYTIDVQGAATLVCVQINERNLPGTVVREKMLDKIQDIQKREDRKLTKKEYASIKDEVIHELLPKAFIRRKVVPVMVFQDKIVLFTGSAKVADDVMALLIAFVGSDKMFKPHLMQNLVENNIDGALTALARDGSSDQTEGEPFVSISTVGTLKGAAKQTISIKDKDMASHDVSNLLKQEYSVVKLGLELFSPGEVDPDCGFTLTDKLVFSQFKIAQAVSVRGKSVEDQAATFIGTAYMVARAVRDAIDVILVIMGGIKAQPSEQAAHETAIDDDEL